MGTTKAELAEDVCDAVEGYYQGVDRDRDRDRDPAARLRVVAKREKQQNWPSHSEWLERIADAYERYAASGEAEAEPAPPRFKVGDRVRVVEKPTVPNGKCTGCDDALASTVVILKSRDIENDAVFWNVRRANDPEEVVWECNLELLPAAACRAGGGALGDDAWQGECRECVRARKDAWAKVVIAKVEELRAAGHVVEVRMCDDPAPLNGGGSDWRPETWNDPNRHAGQWMQYREPHDVGRVGICGGWKGPYALHAGNIDAVRLVHPAVPAQPERRATVLLEKGD